MKTILATAAACILLAGCATMTRGTTDILTVESSPSGAAVRTSNAMACTTPCSLTMPRKSNIDVVISHVGYWPATVNVVGQIKGMEGGLATAGNMILGGLPGMAVDISTGADLTLFPNPVHVDLIPVTVPRTVGRVGS